MDLLEIDAILGKSVFRRISVGVRVSYTKSIKYSFEMYLKSVATAMTKLRNQLDES